LLVLAGCSHRYTHDYPQNLTFSAPGFEGSFLSNTEVSLNIFFADGACDLDFQGAVTLKPGAGPVTIGVPTGQHVYARIFYSHKGFFSSTQRQRAHELRFQPRSGYDYSFEYATTKNAYETRLRKIKRSSGRASELATDGWDACEVAQN
jgi:hypothetical protein